MTFTARRVICACFAKRNIARQNSVEKITRCLNPLSRGNGTMARFIVIELVENNCSSLWSGMAVMPRTYLKIA